LIHSLMLIVVWIFAFYLAYSVFRQSIW
jgi:hypothetical protein